MAEKVIIGLTGNIATGKSLVLRMLQELGATTIDADKLVHQMMRKDSPAYGKIVEEFGKFILDKDGQINRSRLGRIVFGMPEAMARLEEITHPAVKQDITRRIEKSPTPVIAIEAVKLFESGISELCTSTWAVTAPPKIQLQRLVERRRMKPEHAQQRIRAQSGQKEKVAKADISIENSGELGKTWTVVRGHFTSLTKNTSTEAPQKASAKPATQASPKASADTSKIEIRRAKRTDLQGMADMIAEGTKSKVKLDLSDMMERLFSRAYMVALDPDEKIVGMIGWQTENLIAGIEDLHVRSDLWSTVGKQMLDKVHEEVDGLSCEVVLAFLLKHDKKAIEFLASQDYTQTELRKLNFMWREAAEEWQSEDSILLYKKLRDQQIMVPM